MIETLNWDSDFFGLSIGKLVIDPNFKLTLLDTEKKTYDLLYLFSDKSLNFQSEYDIKLVDVKVNFTKEGLTLNREQFCQEFNPDLHAYPEILELAYLSGVYSRFKLDRHFHVESFKKLYKTWLDNSISKKIANYVLVEIIDGVIAGFVTLKLYDQRYGQIGLIAVHPNYQGKRIASKLIQSCENLCVLNQINKLNVSTQLDNKPAMNLYKNSKFNIQDQQFIYHYWTL